MPSKNENDQTVKKMTAILEELTAIKHLLILLLYGANVPDEEIDKAVHMGAANIRAMFSKKKIKKGGTKLIKEIIQGVKGKK